MKFFKRKQKSLPIQKTNQELLLEQIIDAIAEENCEFKPKSSLVDGGDVASSESYLELKINNLTVVLTISHSGGYAKIFHPITLFFTCSQVTEIRKALDKYHANKYLDAIIKYDTCREM